MPPTTLLKLVRPSAHQIAPRTSSSLLRTACPKRSFYSTNRSLQTPIQTSSSTPAAPANLTAEQYNEFSDAYMDALVAKLEELQDASEEIDVDYSAGVLTLVFPPAGTYVLNKQPPNKQIWLSSPISGPKRYDFVMASEGQDAKEGTGSGEWVYLRDGSTLNEVLASEIGVDMGNAYSAVGHLGE
ncbi:Frataxin-like protein, mitochondrial [Lachnellula subtilissima]|uniref:ferroxidase n=1 Tax=Lachnellula subtilissima TaxID=602034 RepID=A0A8H8RU96_9HELO|nr:Frataxin-like protein, mitochondrial [Lachnellula subtilissima]